MFKILEMSANVTSFFLPVPSADTSAEVQERVIEIKIRYTQDFGWMLFDFSGIFGNKRCSDGFEHTIFNRIQLKGVNTGFVGF